MSKLRQVRPLRMVSMDTPVTKKDYYPTISLSFKEFPEAKDWKVGESYSVELSLKEIARNEGEYGGGATFEIRAIKADEDSDD